MKAVKRLSMLLAVLLVLSVAVVGFVVSADEEVTVITVTDEASFNAAMVEANASATIVLANDITLTAGNTTMGGNFTGTFDGKGYTISGVTNTLFSLVKGGTVKDVVLEGTIDGGNNRKAASVAFDVTHNGKIEGIVSYVDITMTASDLNAGGIVGYAKYAQFADCVYAGNYTANVTGAGCSVGGVVGYSNNNKDGNTEPNNYVNCAFTGTLTVNGACTGNVQIGGIAGTLKGYGQIVTDCDSTGTITVAATTSNNSYSIAGLVGHNDNDISAINGGFANATITAPEGVTPVAIMASGNAVVDGVVVPVKVATADEFRAAMVEANNAAYIILTADIDLGEAGNTTMGGTFTGTFDGQGYTISGVTNTLFPKIVDGTVKNVTVNGTITASNRDAGTLSVRAEGSTIENVVSNVNITVTGAQSDLNAGGIVGYGKRTTFTNCTYAGTYTVENGGGGGFGGIVGYVNNDNQANTYTDCAFIGTIVVNGTQAGTLNLGPIVGRAKSGAITIVRSLNLGTFNLNNAACTYKFGGVAGTMEDAGSVVSGAFVQDTIALGEGVNASRAVFIGNAAQGITATGAIKLPDNYLANDGEGLAAVFKYMPADAIVKVNADMTLPAGTPTYTTGDFSGTLDGQGHTVSGITNTMFKKISGGTVKNITLEGDVDYTAEADNNIARKAAALAWDAANVTLENIVCNVNVATTASDLNAGGIIGYANQATFTNCTYAGTYSATWTGAAGSVGGIAGYIRTGDATNTYTNCAFTGTLNVYGAVEGQNMFVGGVVGKHRQGTVNVVDFTNTGVINVETTAGSIYAGGFIGTDNDVVTLTMSGMFDGTINAPEGATVDNFLAHDDKNPADVTGCYTNVPFAEGVITLQGSNKYTISSEGYSAFLSKRVNANGTQDYRFVVAANKEAFKANEGMNMVITFSKDGAVVKTATKNVKTDLNLYASATAAGNTYVAADGSLLFGIVITDVPAEAWDTVSVKLVDGETLLGTGSITVDATMADADPSVTLPVIGLSKLTVDAATVTADGIAPWGDGPATNLFDGDTQATKIGGSVTVDETTKTATFSVNFSLTEASTVYFYTFTTGGDTGAYGRNPDTWVLYGKVGEDWVVLDTVGDASHNGLEKVNRTPFSYAVDTPVECKDYKVEFTSDEGAFQMNELELFTSAYDYTNAIDISDAIGGYFFLGVEDHHEDLHNNPSIVVGIEHDTIYPDIYTGGFNANYDWIISVNGGEAFVTPAQSCYDGETWGYLRSELGAEYATYNKLQISYIIVEKETGKVKYFDDLDTINYGFLLDETKPVEVAPVDPSTITVIGGPDIGGGEGADKVFDGSFKTKVCTGSDGADNAIIASLATTTTLKGVGLCNANDNEGSNGRTVLAFEIYVSMDGENWGEPVYVATGEGLNKADYSTNFMEIYYGFDAPVEANFVKVVVNNGELYQLSEIFLYTYTNDPVAIYEGAEQLWFHANGGMLNETEIKVTVKAETGHFPNGADSISTIKPAFVFIKDVTNGGEFVKYDITSLRTERWCDIIFTVDGFTFADGVQYEVYLFIIGGETCKVPDALHGLHWTK